jgi:hypothetical protein
MTSSPASWFGNHLLQLFDQIFDRKASRSCPGDAIGYDLGQLPRAFNFPASQLLRADESAGSLVSLQQSA